MIERIVSDNNVLFAIIIRSDFKEEGIRFMTPDEFSQQLAFMKHPAGKKIKAHKHNLVNREIFLTNEVLFIRKGKIRVDFYETDEKYTISSILKTGDVILLVSGGHGFEIIEDCEMIEVKQGPYLGERDKQVFDGIIDKINLFKKDE